MHRRLVGSALVLLALLVASPAHALNKLVNWDFETGGSWLLFSELPNSNTEVLFERVAGGVNGSAMAFEGSWVGTGSTAGWTHRGLQQTYTPATNVRALLRGHYRRTKSGSGNPTSYRFRLMAFLGTTAQFTAIDLTTSANDSNWASDGQAATLTAGSAYRIEARWDIQTNQNATVGAKIDAIQLHTSPTGVAAAAVAGSTNVQVSWTASTGDPGLRATQGYGVYSWTGPTADTTPTFSDTNSLLVTGLEGNRTYSFDVTDFDTTGYESPRSLTVQRLTCPGQPTGLSFTGVTQTAMTVGWTAPKNGASTYTLERALDAAGPWASVPNTGVGGTSLYVSGLTCGTTYWYRVRGANASGSGDWSVATSQTTSPCPATTVADGTDPANATLCPGAVSMLDAFTLRTNTGSDNVTSVTVQLAAGARSWLDELEITGDAGGAVYGSVSSLAADTVTVPLNATIPVSTTAVQYKVRATVKGYATAPAGSFVLTGRVTDFGSTNNPGNKVLTDTDSASLTLDHAPADEVSLAQPSVGDGTLTLSWTNPTVGFAGVVVLRDTIAIPGTLRLEDGKALAQGASVGTATVVYVGSGSTLVQTGLANGTSYHYRLFTYDSCTSYSSGVGAGPLIPRATTTVGEGGTPAPSTTCPGDATASVIDEFSLQTSSGTDSVTAVTVALSAGSQVAVGRVEITSADGKTVYGSVEAPGSATVTVTLATPIAVDTTRKNYRLAIVPMSLAAAPAPPGAATSVQGTVSTLTCTNPAVLADLQGATVTVDNASPPAPVLTDASPDDRAVALGWTHGTGETVVIVRDSSPVSALPVEGTTYSVGNSLGSAQVVYVGNGTTFTDSGLTNGSTYHYALFAFDGCRNYSPAAPSGAMLPSPVVVQLGSGTDPTPAAICTGGAATVVDQFTMQTTRKTASVTGLTVQLGTGNAAVVQKVEVLDKAQVLGSAEDPASDTVEVTFAAPLAVDVKESRYELRLTPKAHTLSPPGASLALTAAVTGLAAGPASISGTDTGATLAVDDLGPVPATWGETLAEDGQISLAWTLPADAAGALLVRDTKASFTAPADGQTYSAGSNLGTGSILSSGAELSHLDLAAANGTSYWYALFTRDACGNYSLAATVGPLVPGAATLAVGNGTNPPDGVVCPGAALTDLDAFTLRTSRGTDSVTALTIALSQGSARAVERLQVTSADGATVYGEARTPAADRVALTLDTPLPAGPTETTFRVRLAPRSHQDLASGGFGALALITGRVESVTSTLQASVGDGSSATLTLDRQGPSAPSTLQVVQEGTGYRVSWSDPADDDLELTLALGGEAPVNDTPTAGVRLQVGDTVGASTVVYLGTETTFADPAGSGSPGWALFARDRCGNYSPAAQLAAPSVVDAGAPDAGSDAGADGGPADAGGGTPAYDLGGCGCGSTGAPAALLGLALVAALPRRRRD